MTNSSRGKQSKATRLNTRINRHIILKVENTRWRTCLTQADLLKKAGVSQSAWNRFCRCQQDLKFQQILKICEVAQIDVAQLLVEIQLLDGEGYQ